MSRSHRVLALARAEAILLRRSPSALLGALVGPLSLALIPLSNSPQSPADPARGTGVLLALAAFTLILSVYYNLVTALVARREEFVLKRLRTGEISDCEIVIGTAVPGVVIAWAQIAFGALIAILLLDLRLPADPAWLLLAGPAIAAGTALCVLLAAAVTTITGTVEMAQFTAAPLLMLSLSLSGALFPLDGLPEPMHRIAQVLPLSPVVDLIRLGLTGTGSVALPVLVLGAWFAAAIWIVRRWFRWEPRR